MTVLMRCMFGFKNLMSLGKEEPDGPEGDLHGDESAEIGDRRIKTIPRGEIFGYDKDHIKGEFLIARETYSKNGTFRNGAKSYDWQLERTIFTGTPEEWRSVKNNPSEIMSDIPANWSAIVDHTENFLSIHEDELDNSEYPHSTRQI